MFTRKKPEPPKRRQHDLSQFGLTEIPDDFDPTAGYGDDGGNDSDLEAELAAIASGNGGGAKPRAKPKPKVLPSSQLDEMIAASMKDISDEDDDDGDAENDTDLLGELRTITGVEDSPMETEAPSPPQDEAPPEIFLPTTHTDIQGVLRQRLAMYKEAEANARAAGEGAKARRLGRGLKTLDEMLKRAAAGKQVNVDDIPPEVSVKAAPPAATPPEASPTADVAEEPKAPLRPAPPPPAPSTPAAEAEADPAPAAEAPKAENPLMEQMRARQQEYKAAALQSKRSGDTATALQFLKVVKQFELVMKLCDAGEAVDLSDMPPPPEEFLAFMAQMQSGTTDANPMAESAEAAPAPAPPVPEPVAEVAPPPTARTILEALQQRLDKYKAVADAAKAEDNASKARRFGRIVKQYEDAIKAHKAGRAVAYDELPVPPGFGPLPTEGGAAPAAAPLSPPPVPAPTQAKPAVAPPQTKPAATPPAPKPRHDLTTRTSGNQQKNSIAEQQMKILLDRQKEFKMAAVEAKRAGELDQAKEYLKIYKGFDALLNAASGGLPVDLNTLPLPPSQRENLEASFAIVAADDCDPDDDISEIGIRIEEQLAKQLMMCKNTRDHHKAMGDIAGMNRFENLAVTVQKDLDLVRYSKRKNFPLPKFHYEQRSFNIVHCNTDLTDNELEVVVVRGINYNVANPKDVDTYVKVEFPLLNDDAFRTKTNLIKDTDSPEYEQRFRVDIQRGNRQFQRIFKRHGVKFEVYSRGGFLRSDLLIGTVNVKLQPLETKCDIHDTFDLMEGRKTVGGKLEVKIRVRNPILTKQMEHLSEKWLVLDA